MPKNGGNLTSKELICSFESQMGVCLYVPKTPEMGHQSPECNRGTDRKCTYGWVDGWMGVLTLFFQRAYLQAGPTHHQPQVRITADGALCVAETVTLT